MLKNAVSCVANYSMLQPSCWLGAACSCDPSMHATKNVRLHTCLGKICGLLAAGCTLAGVVL